MYKFLGNYDFDFTINLQDFKFTSLVEGLTETIKYYENRSSSNK